MPKLVNYYENALLRYTWLVSEYVVTLCVVCVYICMYMLVYVYMLCVCERL